MLLADLPGFGSRHRLEQLVADPELKQPVGNEDVASAATVVLAHADVLRVHADDSVWRHAAGDPLLATALLMSHLMPDLPVVSAESAFRGGILQGLVRTLRVVVGHPLIQ